MSMGVRKTCNSYYFSVEGETERWYLEHLQRLINSSEGAKYSVKFIIKVKKDPREMVKILSVTDKVAVSHFCDMESNDEEHVKGFRSTLNNLKAASRMGKKLSYSLSYSNFTFDLWIALHKVDCNTQLVDRKQYLKYLNDGFSTHFTSMKEYKDENNFKRYLEKITLDDVVSAIKRAEKIMNNNQLNGYKPVEYEKFTYYTENPSLSVHEIITDILKRCQLLSSSQTV
ncbi:MAG: RloB family protein [Bacteroides sp.]|nr:RloB family protein [Eubacterium sp.]MCM1418185.1 RloB family protein [Roseburia sp.]MCM1462290.1 RloB family protein [Bacteroides sp.]